MVQRANPRHVIRVTLRMRVVSFFLLASILPSALAGYLAYHVIARQAEGAAVREVVTISESAAKTATEFMNSRCSDVLVWASLRMIREALDAARKINNLATDLRQTIEQYRT